MRRWLRGKRPCFSRLSLGVSRGNLKQDAMRHVAFRIIVLCVLLPPVLYGFTVQGLEYYLNRKYTRDVEQICVGDASLLLQGSVRLKDAVGTNIERYIQQQRLLSWGVRATVWVTTGSRIVLYPAPVEVSGTPPFPDEALEIATENYSLLQDGLLVSVGVELAFGRLLPNIILGVYVILSVLALYGLYRAGIRKSDQEEAALNEELQRLLVQEQAFSKRLGDLRTDREQVSSERDQLEKTIDEERQKAGSNEAELFDEIVQLDEKLTQNLILQKQQEEEIKALSDRINAYEADKKKVRTRKGKEVDLLAKRFGTLYKNISVHERALDGFATLSEEMKIKGEGVIHRLNEAPDQVPVKRKVFSGKGRETVLEVLFSYNGRLYFRRNSEQRVEVLSVGNKNTQSRDLEFIDKISRRT